MERTPQIIYPYGLMYISVVIEMSGDIDYILQAIGNEVRRKILLHVAREMVKSLGFR